MDLSIHTESYQQEDQSWLGSADGTNSARSVTLDAATFTEATHYPDGYLLSGLPLADQGDGTFGPVNSAATDGTQNLAGFLFTAQVTDGTGHVGAPMLDWGRIVTDKLPVALDAASQDTNPHFRFV